MTGRLTRVLQRIRTLAAKRKVRFTLKALQELADLGMDSLDACETMQALKALDFVERFASQTTGEWMYVFKPQVGGILIYVKLILRNDCLIVSFHEDEGGEHDDEAN